MLAILPIYKTRLHDVDLAGKFALRQGLWIEDLQTPPGQECSNGSLILLAVVLWRTFKGRDRRARQNPKERERNGRPSGPSLRT